MQTPEGTPLQPAECVASAQADARRMVEAGQHELTGEARCAGCLILACRASLPSSRREKVVDVTVDMYDDSNFGPVFRYAVPPADGVSAPFVVYGLPPLNTVLARAVMERSPYARSTPVEPTLDALTALSQVVCDVREVVAMSVTLRVLSDRAHVIAPRITLAAGRSRLAIMPYPRHLEQTLEWRGADDPPDPSGRRGRAQRTARRDDAGGSADAFLRRGAQLRSFAGRAHDADRLRP